MDLGSFQFTVQMVNVDHWLSMLYFVDKDVDAFHATTYFLLFSYDNYPSWIPTVKNPIS